MSRRILACGFALLVAAGCGPAADMPRTNAVTGVVVYQGGQPAKGGQIEFRPAAGGDPSVRVTGEVQDDGHFSLYTLKGAAKSSGAPEGEYQAEYQPPLQPDPRGGQGRMPPPVRSAKTYKIEARKNDLTVELPPPGP